MFYWRLGDERAAGINEVTASFYEGLLNTISQRMLVLYA